MKPAFIHVCAAQVLPMACLLRNPLCPRPVKKMQLAVDISSKDAPSWHENLGLEFFP